MNQDKQDLLIDRLVLEIKKLSTEIKRLETKLILIEIDRNHYRELYLKSGKAKPND